MKEAALILRAKDVVDIMVHDCRNFLHTVHGSDYVDLTEAEDEADVALLFELFRKKALTLPHMACKAAIQDLEDLAAELKKKLEES